MVDYLRNLASINKLISQVKIEAKDKSRTESIDLNGKNGIDDVDTTASKEPNEDDLMTIDNSEKSKYLHRFSLFRNTYVKYFIMEMNYLAREEFKGLNTFFDSPHGMSNRFNTSTAHDVGKMSSIAQKNSYFAKIVRTRRYKGQSIKPDDFEIDNPGQKFTSRTYSWENTNKLLWRGYNGLKTGITTTAGPCLAASYKNELAGEHYIIVVLNSRSMDHRWNEINKLKTWASARMNKIKKSNICEKRVLTKIRHL